MTNFIIGLLIGLWIGGMIGFFTAALMSAAGCSAEDYMRLYVRKAESAEFHFVDG